MISVPPCRRIKIERDEFSYGFKLKDEGKPYEKYAVVSRITNDIASARGLNVGDKIVAINGEKVARKDYIAISCFMRKSLDNCIYLDVLDDSDFQMMYPDTDSCKLTNIPFKFSFGRSLIPTGVIREKIEVFNDKSNKKSKKITNRLSISCEDIHESAFHCQSTHHRAEVTNLDRVTSISAKNLLPDSKSFDSNSSVLQTISQKSFFSEPINVPQNTIEIKLPAANAHRSKVSSQSETPNSFHSDYMVFEKISEPFDDRSLEASANPKLDMLELRSSLSLRSKSNQPSSTVMMTKSQSSNNILDDVSHGWLGKPLENKGHEFGSVSYFKPENKISVSHDTKLQRQSSINKCIPIKLRIILFFEKSRSKNWRDYVLEKESDGVRFRKRDVGNSKPEPINNFIVKFNDISRFEIDSPHRRNKTAPENDDESLMKYTLVSSGSQVQLRFHANPSLIQDDQISRAKLTMYKDIINSFKLEENKKLTKSIDENLSHSSSLNIGLEGSQKSTSSISDLNLSTELTNSDNPNSTLTVYKQTSKSSTENISDTNQSLTKTIINKAIGKRIEKRIAQTYTTITGTKDDYKDFKKQLETGYMPLELDNFEENGINFNRFIYDVPRMATDPKIPMVIYLCTDIIENIALRVKGIYRISGNNRVVRLLSLALNEPLDDIDTKLPEWNNVHAVCGTLKLFLRKLKQYLIPKNLSFVLAYSCKGVNCEDQESLCKTLQDIRYHLSSFRIPFPNKLNSNIDDQIKCHWESLRYVLKHLAKVVSFQEYNSMDEHAVSICFNPVLMESWQNSLTDIKADNEIMAKALELILVHQDWLFENWHSELSCSFGLELVENAQKYVKEFFDKKYDFNIKPQDFDNCDSGNDFNVNNRVSCIVSGAVMVSEDKNKPKSPRRHSSHTLGGRPIILRDTNDIHKQFKVHRNSQTTDALDLCTSRMNPIAKADTIREHKESRTTEEYIFFYSLEPAIPHEQYRPRRLSVEGTVEMNCSVNAYSDHSKGGRLTDSSQKQVTSECQRL